MNFHPGPVQLRDARLVPGAEQPLQESAGRAAGGPQQPQEHVRDQPQETAGGRRSGKLHFAIYVDVLVTIVAFCGFQSGLLKITKNLI